MTASFKPARLSPSDIKSAETSSPSTSFSEARTALTGWLNGAVTRKVLLLSALFYQLMALAPFVIYQLGDQGPVSILLVVVGVAAGVMSLTLSGLVISMYNEQLKTSYPDKKARPLNILEMQFIVFLIAMCIEVLTLII